MYPNSGNYPNLTNTNLYIGMPTVPDLAKIRQWLLDEGSVAKSELVKLIKDVTKVFCNNKHGLAVLIIV